MKLVPIINQPNRYKATHWHVVGTLPGSRDVAVRERKTKQNKTIKNKYKKENLDGAQ